MKQYKQILPFLRLFLVLAVSGLFPLFAAAQGITDPRWYFGNSPQWISFLDGSAKLGPAPAQLPLGTGGSVVATDLQTGDLLFYAGGGLVVNASGASTPLTGNPNLPQPVHAVPAAIPDTYNLFVLDAQGSLSYFPYNYVTNVLGAAVPLNLNGTATGTMELIRGASPNGYVYWLVVPLVPQNGITEMALIKIDGGLPGTPTTFSLSNLPYPISARSLAFSEEKGLLAMGSAASADSIPVLLFSFNTDPQLTDPDFARIELVDTLTNLLALNGAITGLAWKENYLYASKSQNAAGTNSTVYRFEIDNDFTDNPRAEAVSGSAFFQGFDLKTGPDGRVYHLYRQQAGGPILAGYIRNSGTENPSFVASPFGNIDFAGEQFNKLAPPPPTDYNIGFNYVNGCTEIITYFYPKFNERAPQRVEWRLGGPTGQVFSTELQPVVENIFAQAGAQSVTLTAYYPDGVVSETLPVNVSQGFTIQVEPEYILCPDETKTVEPKVMQNGSEVQGAEQNLVWFKPRSVKHLPNSGPNPETAPTLDLVATAVPHPTIPDTTMYPVAGTYFVVYNDPNSGCQISASFQVRVYNYEYSKANLWYFGDGAALDFSTGEPTPEVEYPNPMRGADQAPEGVTLVVDPNVDPLFSTNGVKLWVRDYQPIPLDDVDDPAAHADDNPNGETVGGTKEISQNSLFEQFPADPALYYLFTISGPNAPGGRALKFNVADLKGNAPILDPVQSDVEQATDPSGDFIRARLLQNDVAEKLISVMGDSSRIWVITHGLDNNRFYSYPITVAGIGPPVESSAGAVHAETEAAGYLVASSSGDLLAAAFGNKVQVYRFDKTTGKVLPDDTPMLTASAPTYGVSFSPNDSLLYFTAGRKLYQTGLDSALTQTYLETNLIEVAENPDADFGAIQRAPNNQLYVARPNTQQLGSITSPDLKVTAANKDMAYQTDGLSNPLLPGTSTLKGLPNLRRQIGDAPGDPTVSANNACFGETVVARGTNRYNNELYVFILKELIDGQYSEIRRSAASEADSIVYENLAAGSYQVELQLEACDLVYPITMPEYKGKSPVVANFEVYPQEAASIIPQNPNLCDQQSVLLTALITVNGDTVSDLSNYEILWIFNGLQVVGSGSTFEATSQGNYQVQATNLITECSVLPAAVDVLDFRPDADLGEDINICPDDVLPNDLSVNVDQSLFDIRWLRSDNFGPFKDLNNTNATQPLDGIDTDQPGTYRFMVEVKAITDPSNPNPQECIKQDTISIQINAAPLVDLRATNNDCSGTGADLVASVSGGQGPYLFEFFRDGVSVGTSSSGTLNVTQNGTYTVRATPTVSGSSCPGESQAVVVDLFNAIASVGIDVEAGCKIDGVTGLSTLTAYTSYTGSVRYRWEEINSNGDKIRDVNQNAESISVPDGIYRVWAEATDGGCPGAAASAEATAKSLITPQSIIQPNYTICPSIESREFARVDLTGQNYQEVTLLNRTTGQQRAITQPFILIYEPGTYELRVGACTDPAVFTVSIDCTPVLYLPNAIRPLGKISGNAALKILNTDMIPHVKDFEVLVYDRWGEVIWRSEDPAFEWKGNRYNGGAVPMGNYPYLIRYRNASGEDGEVKKLIGNVFVMY